MISPLVAFKGGSLTHNPNFLKGVEYARIQELLQGSAWSVVYLWIFVGFVLSTLGVVAFFWLKSYYSTNKKDPFYYITNKIYSIFSLVTLYSILLGILFGRGTFHLFFLILLFIPLYLLVTYFFDFEKYVVFALSAQRVILVIYCTALITSLFLCTAAMQLHMAEVLHLSLLEKSIFFPEIGEKKMVFSKAVIPSQKEATVLLASPLEPAANPAPVAVPRLTVELLEIAGSPRKPVVWQETTGGSLSLPRLASLAADVIINRLPLQGDEQDLLSQGTHIKAALGHT